MTTESRAGGVSGLSSPDKSEAIIVCPQLCNILNNLQILTGELGGKSGKLERIVVNIFIKSINPFGPFERPNDIVCYRGGQYFVANLK